MMLLSQTMTHPETARWVLLVPQALAVTTLLSLALLLRGRLLAGAQRLITRRAARTRLAPVDPALVFVPPIVSAPQFLSLCALSALIILVPLLQLGGLFIALILAGPATALLLWLALWVLEQRYISKLDRALPAAISRYAGLLSAGTGPQPALEQVTLDLPPGPLKTEWSFIIERLGVPLLGGTRATAADAIAALVLQTPSARHRGLLGHMEMALNQTQDVLRNRMQAASNALYAAEQRRSAAATELAQMRYSGIAVGLAGLVMAGYLLTTQAERFAAAYQGPLGFVIGLVVIAALLAPIIGGFLLSQAEEQDY